MATVLKTVRQSNGDRVISCKVCSWVHRCEARVSKYRRSAHAKGPEHQQRLRETRKSRMGFRR